MMSPPTDASFPLDIHPGLAVIPAPALPEPLNEDDGHVPPSAIVDNNHAAAAVGNYGGVDNHAAVAAAAAAAAAAVNQEDPGEAGGEAGALTPADPPKKKRIRKINLTYHEALTFAHRGVYVDIESGQLRCSCNHKVCDKWDAYGYTRHFAFKVHKKYEAERLDDAEAARLKECKETYFRLNPVVQESSLRRRKRKAKDGEKVLSVEELRVQERHWMSMWKDAKNALRELREDLKTETDEVVRAEIMADIEGMKKRKSDWARLLRLNDEMTVSL